MHHHDGTLPFIAIISPALPTHRFSGVAARGFLLSIKRPSPRGRGWERGLR